MRELLLSIAPPESLSAAGFLLLVAGLLGEVAVLIVPSQKYLAHATLGLLFAATVVVGVTIEHIGDNESFRIVSDRANVAEQQLKKLAARDLSPEKQELVASKIKDFAGQKYATAISQGIDDGFSFWKTLYLALEKAGWKYIPPTSLAAGDPPAAIPIATGLGVNILVDRAKLKELEPAVSALGNALIAEGIKVTANISPYNQTDEVQQSMIQIVIGVRAQP